MTSLDTIANLFRSYKWLIICIILGAVAIGIIAAQLTFQKSPKVTSNPLNLENLGSKSIQLELDSNFKYPQKYPKELPIYFKKSTSFVDSQTQVAQKLGFSQSPIRLDDANLGSGIVYSNEDGALSIYPHQISYHRYPKENTGSANFPDPKELKSKALNFISSLGLTTNFAQDFQTNYLKAQDEFVSRTEDPKEATRIQIELKYELSGIEVLNTKNNTTVTFDRGGNILKFVYVQFSAEPSTQNYNIISPEDAKNILNTSPALVKITTSNNFEPLEEPVASAVITEATLAYYLNYKNNDPIQPVWIFRGKSKASQNTEATLYYAVPAIKP